jgi:plasmid stability protein
MAQLLIRNLDPEIIEHLKERARRNNRSLQGEAKALLEESFPVSAREALAISQKWRSQLDGKIRGDSAGMIRENRRR